MVSPFRHQVSDLLARPGTHRDARFRADVPFLFDLAKVETPASIEVRFDATGREVIASGTVSVVVAFTCQRCLTDFAEERPVRFSQVFQVGADPEDDEVLPVDPHGFVDLEQAIRDEVGLAIPLAPVCRADCRGLCPTCGTDLNTDPCEGHAAEVASPFAVLEHFLDRRD